MLKACFSCFVTAVHDIKVYLNPPTRFLVLVCHVLVVRMFVIEPKKNYIGRFSQKQLFRAALGGKLG